MNNQRTYTCAGDDVVCVVIRRLDPGDVETKARTTGSWIEPRRTREATGVGLPNLSRRLELIYPNEHRVEITHDDGWVSVVVRIPTRRPYENILACGAGG